MVKKRIQGLSMDEIEEGEEQLMRLNKIKCEA